MPPELKVTAISHDEVIMGIEHKTFPIAAVQFHPESIMTLAGEVGLKIIRNAICTYAKSNTLRQGDKGRGSRGAGENSSLTTNH
jgi:anthranilate synthase